jgi:hypothetical protein
MLADAEMNESSPLPDPRTCIIAGRWKKQPRLLPKAQRP